MTVTPAVEPHADAAALKRSLAATTGEAVTVRETHGAIVFLVGNRAYKLRKPVAFDWVDWRPAAARAAAARRDVALNAPLAHAVVLGVRSVVPADGGERYALAGPDDERAIDHVVEMRRFNEDDTLHRLVAHGAATPAHFAAAGARVAAFHRTAERRSEGVDYRKLVDRNFEALLPLAEDLLGSGERLALQRFAAAYLLDFDGVLAARARRGKVIDGHGDLRAEHVIFEHGTAQVVDRLEFDELRVVDVADELAFLLMELTELTGTRAAGDAVLDGYVQAGGDAQPESLLAFFGAYRAQVRAKVALVRSTQPGIDPLPLRAHARRLLALSRRLGWQARGPLRLLVTGPPAAGKSTLAAALGRASGLPVLSSDAIRREHPHRPADYRFDARAGVYAELGRRTALERAVIVNATFGDDRMQQAFAGQLAAPSGILSVVVDCHAPMDVRVARAAARQRRGHALSDAGPAEARRLGADPAVLGSDAGAAHLAIDTRAPVAAQVDEVASWMDTLLAAGVNV